MNIYRYLLSACACAVVATLCLPAASQQTPAPQGDDLALLKQLVQDQAKEISQLKERLSRLEQGQPVKPAAPTTPADEPPIPAIEIPTDNGEAPAQPTQSAGPVAGATKASNIPDLSVIGNNVGRFFSKRGDPDRNHLQLGEFEIGLQQPIFPGIRFDAFLAGDASEKFTLSAEEAYITMSSIGHLPLGGYLGQKRLDIGKVNAIHPHARAYADQPAVISQMLGADGLSGNGAALTYLLPNKNLFVNAELGLWKVDPSEDGMTASPQLGSNFYSAGLGVKGQLPLGRLWLSKELSKSDELELGAGGGFGRADNGDDIRIASLDFTYRNLPSTFKRLMLQGEVFWHNRADVNFGTGSHTRSGHYLLATYRPDQYYEYGVRYDNSKLPWPFPGRDQSLSLIWSNRLTEVTQLRLQLKHGYRSTDLFLPASKDYNELLVQFIWGGGSHTHPLQ